MNQNDIRSQRQCEQDERRLSLQRNNAYFSFVSPQIGDRAPSPSTNSKLLPSANDRPRSCSPSLPASAHKSWSEETASPTPLLSQRQTTVPGNCNTAITSAVTSLATATTSTSSAAQLIIAVPAVNNSAALTVCNNNNARKEESKQKQKSISTVQTGMDRYIQIKRKLSPQNNKAGNQPKINRTNNGNENSAVNNSNRYAILADSATEQPNEKTVGEPKKTRPPPIFIREQSTNALVNKLVALIGDSKFHIIPLKKGNIHEIKLQIQTEADHRIVTKYLNDAGKNYYTYQLKSCKGLQVVLKGIEATVTPAEIIEALKAKNFSAKTAINILNKDKVPQPLFKIELEPELQALKKNEVHPIYNLQYLLHRRITVEEPHKRINPVQCTNCQEYGHTKAYCTLKSVCVVCSEPHTTANCPKNKDDKSVKKCSNCGEKHTANYRGCVVYKELKSRLNKRIATAHTYNKVNFYSPQPIFQPPLTVPSTTPTISFASALKSGLEVPAPPTRTAHSEHTPTNIQQTQQSGIEAMMLSLQQSMKDFMTFMQNTLQELMKNQNILIQLLVSSKSP
nr:putative RNA binding protein [Drosophila simulans]UFQ43034.1 putative RNA binding protein [Drosophila melanogaster]CAA35586.1 ORF1 for putative RNA binding protein [Drosophila melanogaster]